MKSNLKYPALYELDEKHYATISVSDPVNGEAMSYDDPYMTATHQNGNFILIWKLKDGRLVHNHLVDSEELVLYKTLFDGSGMLAKPMNKFLEEFDLV